MNGAAGPISVPHLESFYTALKKLHDRALVDMSHLPSLGVLPSLQAAIFPEKKKRINPNEESLSYVRLRKKSCVREDYVLKVNLWALRAFVVIFPRMTFTPLVALELLADESHFP